jgi:hypothetical protein
MRKFRISDDGLKTTGLAIPVTLRNSGYPGSSGDISNMCSLSLANSLSRNEANACDCARKVALPTTPPPSFPLGFALIFLPRRLGPGSDCCGFAVRVMGDQRQ